MAFSISKAINFDGLHSHLGTITNPPSSCFFNSLLLLSFNIQPFSLFDILEFFLVCLKEEETETNEKLVLFIAQSSSGDRNYPSASSQRPRVKTSYRHIAEELPS